ncbi:MAG: deoxyribodipyrimidine photolyase [Pseudanabaena frigida]|uniref:Deoxyribodipyrimidine photolyase n=1 Tax=Pseudanabaena frigida TaxID=945775 RepID=A0A2W4WF49_9CYAN|nr:MAG: deoxyribodipyrimidine photolyase [Pseudanabaena frigida]
MPLTVVWFRQDLRVCDHEPLHRAARRGQVIPIYIFERSLLLHPEACSAQIAFVLECLKSLDRDLQKLGGRLILRIGNPVEILPNLIAATHAEGIYAYKDCDRIYSRVRDAKLNATLAERQMKVRWFEPPASIDELVPYPQYRNKWYADMNAAIAPTPQRIVVPNDIFSENLPSLEELEHKPDCKFIPEGGTEPARSLLKEFFDRKAESYYWQLSYPSAEATTGLSPYIKVGAISIRECVQFAKVFTKDRDLRIQRSSKQLISRLRWGSGFHQRFRYMPQLELRSLYTVFDDEGWEFNQDQYRKWQQGLTGFPIVDAAAKCLLATGGWKELNFRSRAIYSSFLSNLLGMDWRYGALHFMQHLLDADCAIDHYQWAMQAGVTHCVDKSWTRIYNPGAVAIARCDPEGKFIKRWLPELADVPVAQLGENLKMYGYPEPMIDYKQSRQKRVKQLERQRAVFRNQKNVLPYLARMPEFPIPFALKSFDAYSDWISERNPALFPEALNLDTLDPEQAINLRTWLVAHVEIQPHKPSSLQPKKAVSSNKSTPKFSSKKVKPKEETKAVQLSLFDSLF